jgi:UDPglucose 6-dehydrogenase
MKITIYGAGYVGLVTGACFAEYGNTVLCMDVDQSRIDKLNQGDCPIHEPGLPEILQKNCASGNLRFTTNVEEAVKHGVYQFIAVGTPQDEDGSADLQYVLKVAENIGKYLEQYRVVITKSTVPVNTSKKVKKIIDTALKNRSKNIEFDVVSNPEFLREGAAIGDFMNSDRIIIGVENHRAEEYLKQLYAPFDRNQNRLITMGLSSAELAKYIANGMLAMKISFMNEASNIAERVGADIDEVRRGIGSDPRIGHHFIYAGCGYGGSCFPKDIRALEMIAKTHDYFPQLISAVDEVNQRQKNILIQKIKHHYQKDSIKGKVFALWGLAFKPNTDDMREASSRILMEALWLLGARVQAYDPAAMEEVQRIYPAQIKDNRLTLCDSPKKTLQEADALVVVTEWQHFASPDFEEIKTMLKSPVVFDGRNLYDPSYLEKLGFAYYAIGRGKNIFGNENEAASY